MENYARDSQPSSEASPSGRCLLTFALQGLATGGMLAGAQYVADMGIA